MSDGHSRKYKVRYFIDWWTHWLWSGNTETTDIFGYAGLEDRLPLTDSLRKRGRELMDWYVTGMYGLLPQGPDPRMVCIWRQEECDRFKAASHAFFADLQQELGPDFEAVYEQDEPDEDPDLDAYLADVENFQRLAEITVIAIAYRWVKDNQIQLLACQNEAQPTISFPYVVTDTHQAPKPELAALELVSKLTGVTEFERLRKYRSQSMPSTTTYVHGRQRVLERYTHVYAIEIAPTNENLLQQFRNRVTKTHMPACRWFSIIELSNVREDHQVYLTHFSDFANAEKYYGHTLAQKDSDKVETGRKFLIRH